MKIILINIWHLFLWLLGVAIQIALIFCIPVAGMISIIALFAGKVSLVILVIYMFVLFFKGQWWYMTLESFKYGLMIAGIYVIASLPMILLSLMDFANYVSATGSRWNQRQQLLACQKEEALRYEQEINLHGHDVHVEEGVYEEVLVL